MTALWIAVLALGAFAMVAVPFIPAWREWSRPTDHLPLAVDAHHTNRVDFFATRLREAVQAGGTPRDAEYIEGNFSAAAECRFDALLVTGDLAFGPGCEVQQWAHADGSIGMGHAGVALRRMSAGRAIQLDAECSFERLNAPTIRFGDNHTRELVLPAAETLKARELADLLGCTQMAPGWHRVDGHVVLPPDSRYTGSLVVTGALMIGDRTVIAGSIKARKGVVVGMEAAVIGSVVCEESIHILHGAYVQGPVISETDIVIGARAIIGRPDLRTTVSAPNVMVECGAQAHGTVWAREVGVVWKDA